MTEAQEVTVPGYFSEMRMAQKNAKPSERYTYAKEYMNKRCGLKKEGIGFIQWLKHAAAEQKTTESMLASALAFKELNLQVENDLMEFAAEMGLAVVEAMMKDAQIKEAKEHFFSRFGYTRQDNDLSEMAKLAAQTDLFIVMRHEVPHYIVNRSNPFTPTTVEELEAAPFNVPSQNVRLQIPDWDSLSEKEWQEMKESMAEERLQRRLAAANEVDTARALSLVDEYRGANYN